MLKYFAMKKCILYFGFLKIFVSAAAVEVHENEIGLSNFEQFITEADSRELFDSLNGKHLLIIPSPFPENLELIKDSSGKTTNVTGPGAVIFQHIAISLNFTFEYYFGEDLPKFLDSVNLTIPGKIDFFMHKNADVMIGAFGYHEKRNKRIDYPYNIIIGQMALMIPALSAQKKNYVAFVWQPFQLAVWIGLIFSLVIGATSLYLISFGLSKIKLKTDTTGKGLSNYVMSESTRFRMALNFIFGLIVVQGSASSQALGRSRQLAILLLAGAWCLVCFVLVTAYSSVVISFLTAPETFKPIINSINDLPMKPEIRVTVNKGWTPDKIFESAVVDEKSAKIFKFVGRELSEHPNQRCAIVDKCMEIVRKGSSAYIMEDNFIERMISEDFKKTRRCDFAIVKEKFLMLPISGFILQKNSQYTKHFSRQIMRMEASGLLNFWLKQATRGRHEYCLKKDHSKRSNSGRRNEDKKSLTMKGLSGAFVVLGVGYSLAVLIFITENCHKRILNNRKIKCQQSKTGGDISPINTLKTEITPITDSSGVIEAANELEDDAISINNPLETKGMFIETFADGEDNNEESSFSVRAHLQVKGGNNGMLNKIQIKVNKLDCAVVNAEVSKEAVKTRGKTWSKYSEKDVKLSYQTPVLITAGSTRDDFSVTKGNKRTAFKEAVPIIKDGDTNLLSPSVVDPTQILDTINRTEKVPADNAGPVEVEDVDFDEILARY